MYGGVGGGVGGGGGGAEADRVLEAVGKNKRGTEDNSKTVFLTFGAECVCVCVCWGEGGADRPLEASRKRRY